MLGDADLSVEIALTSGFNTPAASRAWTDVTAYVEGDESIDITYGRQDQFSAVDPNQCSLTLDNSDGRFTPANTSGAYYPNLKLGRPLRVRARVPASTPGNLLAAEQSTMEPAGSGSSWVVQPGLFSAVQSVARSTVRSWEAAASLLVTWATASAGASAAGTAVSGLTIGKTYTLSAYVWVPAGNPSVRLSFDLYATSTATNTTGAWQRLSVTWTATTSAFWLAIINNSASTAGQTCYVDGIMLDDADTLRAFTPAPPTYLDRFVGHLQEIPASFPGATPGSSVVRVTATSRKARLAKGGELRSVIEEELALDAPAFHYTLGEAEGSTSAGNSAQTLQPAVVVTQRGTGGTLTFGAATGPGTDSLTAATFTRASAGNGKYLATTELYEGTYTLYDENLVLEAWYSTAAATKQTIVELSNNTGSRLMLYVTATGKLAAQLFLPDQAVSTATVTGTTTVSDGATRHARVEVTKDGTGTVAVKLHQNNTVEATATGFVVGDYSGVLLMPNFTKVYIGGGPLAGDSAYPGDLLGGVVAHVAAFGSYLSLGATRFQAHYDAGATGFSGETADLRVARYAAWAGIPAAEVVVDGATSTGVAAVDSTGAAVADLWDLVAVTDGGLVFDRMDGATVFQTRARRLNPVPGVTLNVVQQTVGEDIVPVLDYSATINDATASRPGGASVRSVNQASVDEHGWHRATVELLALTDTELESAASRLTSLYAQPKARIPSVTVDVLNSPLGMVVASSLGISDVIELTNCPVQLGPATQTLFVEGYSESITATSWVVTYNTTSTDGATAWILDSATLSILDSTTILA